MKKDDGTHQVKGGESLSDLRVAEGQEGGRGIHRSEHRVPESGRAALLSTWGQRIV